MKIVIGTPGAPAAARAVFCGQNCPADCRPAVERLTAAGRFDPAAPQVKTAELNGALLLLLGTPEEDDVRHLQQLLGRAVRMAAEERAATLSLELGSYAGTADPALLARTAAVAAREALYRFDDYRLNKPVCALEEVRIVPVRPTAEIERAVALGDALGAAVCQARTAVNRTSRDLTPEALAAWAVSLCEGAPAETEVLDRARLEKLGARALLSVSLGAHNPPTMTVLRYKGDPAHPDRVLALVGKGITYDSGGLSLKSKDGMITMHDDMGGAAAVAAAFSVIARSGMTLNVTAILPACENMVAPQGYRPGDVIGSMDGKTIQIRSTDAEGRLILIDGLTYALRHEKAGRLVDIATLTGGAAKAYGPLVSAYAVTDGALRAGMQTASARSGELMWEMPLIRDYLSYLKSDHADLVNSSAGAGSSMINAAVFLREFTEGKPWMHIDIAGTAWTGKAEDCRAVGGTGVGVVTLYDLCAALAEN